MPVLLAPAPATGGSSGEGSLQWNLRGAGQEATLWATQDLIPVLSLRGKWAEAPAGSSISQGVLGCGQRLPTL